MRKVATMHSLSRPRRSLLFGLLAVVIGLGAAAAVFVARGEGGMGADSRRGSPIAWVSTVTSPPPIAASVALRRVIASLKGGRVRGDIVSARIGKTPPPDMPSLARAAVPSLSVRVKIPSARPGYATEALWQAYLLVGAVVELAGSHRSLQSDIGSIDFSAQSPDGRVYPNLGGAMGYVARGQRFAGAHNTDAQIRESIERRAVALGLTVDSVTVFRALGAAPAVVLTAPNVRVAAASYESWAERLFGSTPLYEGYYLEIRGKDGKPHVWRFASYLTASGGGFVDPAVSG